MSTVQTLRAEEAALSRRVRTSLNAVGYAQLEAIQCETHGSIVTLHGEVNSYYLKQIAQTIAMKVPGVHRVINTVRVRDEQVN